MAPEIVKRPVAAMPPLVMSEAARVSVDWTVILPLDGLGDELVVELCEEPHEEVSTATAMAATASGLPTRPERNRLTDEVTSDPSASCPTGQLVMRTLRLTTRLIKPTPIARPRACG